MRKLMLVAPLALAILAVPAFAGHECCDKAAASDGWCKNCSVGYAFGVPVQMAKLHGALVGVPVSDKCPGCVKADKTNGKCDHCKVAVTSGKAYRSPYAFAVARGKKLDTNNIKCQGCAKGAKSGEYTWCDGCSVGIVSGYAFDDKGQYEEAVEAIIIIKNASDAKCEVCAVGMVTDGNCENCKVAFKDGKVSKT